MDPAKLMGNDVAMLVARQPQITVMMIAREEYETFNVHFWDAVSCKYPMALCAQVHSLSCTSSCQYH